MDETEHWRLRLLELEEAQKDFGLTRHKDMAEKIGVEPSYYSRLRYEPGKTGRKNLGLDTLRAAVKAFGLRYDWFDLPLGSELPKPRTGAVVAHDAEPENGLRFSIADISPPAVAPRPGVIWPFTDTSYKRLQAMLDSLDKNQRAEALRDLDSLLDVAVARWESRAAQQSKRAV